MNELIYSIKLEEKNSSPTADVGRNHGCIIDRRTQDDNRLLPRHFTSFHLSAPPRCLRTLSPLEKDVKNSETQHRCRNSSCRTGDMAGSLIRLFSYFCFFSNSKQFTCQISELDVSIERMTATLNTFTFSYCNVSPEKFQLAMFKCPQRRQHLCILSLVLLYVKQFNV